MTPQEIADWLIPEGDAPNARSSGGNPLPAFEDPLELIEFLEGDVPEAFVNAHIAYIYGDAVVNTARPDESITRAEALAILYRLLSDPAKTAERAQAFPDVPQEEDDENWFAHEVNYMAASGVVQGYEDGLFLPFEPITRAEWAAMVAKFNQWDLQINEPFTDTAGHWAADYISIAASRWWVEGYDDGSFRPDEYITRAELVTSMNKILKRGLAPETIPAAGAPSFTDLDGTHWAYTEIIEAARPAHSSEPIDKRYETWGFALESAVEIQRR